MSSCKCFNPTNFTIHFFLPFPQKQQCNDENSASTACITPTEDYQTDPKAEGRLRLRRWFTEECRQHSHRLSTVSIHFRCDWCTIVQWEVLPLQWWKQKHQNGVPVSEIVMTLPNYLSKPYSVLFSPFHRGYYFVFKSGEILPTAEKRTWDIQNFHYNNVAAAMLTLFAVQTTEGWPT